MRQKLESLIRAGRFDEARAILRKLRLNKISREEAVFYANIARRIGRISSAIRILNPIVRPRTPKPLPATDAEKTEYAECLRRLGAFDEALKIFHSIDPERFPQVKFHLALCFFSQWDYLSAIPLLRSYINTLEESSYAMTVAQVNLAAALIHENEINKADELLKQILARTEGAEFSLIRGNSLMLAAEMEVARENWEQATSYLDMASVKLHGAKDSTDALLVRKWKAIIASEKAKKVTQDLLSVSAQAISLRHWETLRECEFYKARISEDKNLLIRLYFGTPYENYRQRIADSLPAGVTLPDTFLWQGDYKRKPQKIFNLANAEFEGGKVELPQGRALHRLLILLSQDVYKPVPLVSIFARIFGGEYYNPHTSPNRVHLLVKRLRGWINDHNVPLKITEINGSYQLQINGAFALRVPRETLPLNHKDLEFAKLCTTFSGVSFSTQDVVKLMGSSAPTARRLLRWAVSEGKIQGIGDGPSRRYKFVA